MTDQPKYACWAEHAEDLTEAVQRERENPGELSLRYVGAPGNKGLAPTKLVVACSEGHLNTFEV